MLAKSFRLTSLLFVGLATPLMLNGCGGSAALGINAKMSVQLFRTDSSQVMTNYEMYITKDAATSFDSSDFESFASTTNQPSWIDEYSTTRANDNLKLNFRTRSTQVPYFLFVKVPNTGSAFETLKLQIDVNSKTGDRKSYNLTINSTQRLTGVRIDRDSASY